MVFDLGEGLAGPLVLGVEPLLSRIESGDPRLQGGEVVLGLLGPSQRRLTGLDETAHLGFGRRGTRAQTVELAMQPGQALTPVGCGPLKAGDSTLLLGVRRLRSRARLQSGGQHGRQGLHLGRDCGLLCSHRLGAALHLVGIAVGEGGFGRIGGIANPLVGQGLCAPDPVAQPGQAEPGVLGSRQRGEILTQGRLESGLLLTGGRGQGFDLGAALDQDRFIGDLLSQRGARGDEVVGDEAGLRITQVGLHSGRLAGHLGLTTQRLELAPDLVEQVGQSGEVAVGGIEFAQRLLFALAMLEDPRRLLDEPASVLGSGVQDGVELALADDDVHLATDAGVAEQLLHVEQSAMLTVDRVVRATVAEHGAADGDFGVLDGEGAVGVVDGQLDLGSAQRRSSGGSGEDDVFHLPAAKALRALFAHHPRQGVDDVGLARTVGSDDAGDPGFELQGGRGREGLEALHGQALEIQALAPCRRVGRRHILPVSGPPTGPGEARQAQVSSRDPSSRAGASQRHIDLAQCLGHGPAGLLPRSEAYDDSWTQVDDLTVGEFDGPGAGDHDEDLIDLCVDGGAEAHLPEPDLDRAQLGQRRECGRGRAADDVGGRQRDMGQFVSGQIRGQEAHGPILPHDQWAAVSVATPVSCAICGSWRQMATRISAEPAKPNQKGATIPQWLATTPPMTWPTRSPPNMAIM